MYNDTIRKSICFVNTDELGENGIDKKYPAAMSVKNADPICRIDKKKRLFFIEYY